MTTSIVNATASAALAGAGRAHGPGTPPLWHRTCGHFYLPILAVGALIPHRHPLFPTMVPVVWFSDDPDPDPAAAGLTSTTLPCDRMAHRFLADDTGTCLPWPEVRDALAATQEPGFDKATLYMFQHERAPDTWWVSAHPVPVVPA